MNLLQKIASAAGAASAEDAFPVRPIELVVPSSPGGGSDLAARLFAQAAGRYLPQPIIVRNRPGAAGADGLAEVQQASADGYTMGVLISELAILPHLGLARANPRDFVAIGRLDVEPGLVAVRADSGLQSIEDLLARCRAQPGVFSMGNAGTGSIWHLAAAAIEDQNAVRFHHVPFDGAAPGVCALLEGKVDAVIASAAELCVHVAAGRLRVLVSLAEQAMAAPFEQVPSFRDKGLDLTVGTWRGLGLPHGTPAHAVKVLCEATRLTCADAAFRAALHAAGLQPAWLDGDAFRTFIGSQSAYFRKLLAGLDLQH